MVAMEMIKIDRESGIPLIGLAYIGVVLRSNNSLIQVRPTTLCNMNCGFCSTDAGCNSRHNQYVVELGWLLEWVKAVVEHYEEIDWVHIDSVGEVMMYKDLFKLIKGLKKIKGVGKVSMVTNGSLLTKDNIKKLEDAGLDKLNISMHSLDKEKARLLFGTKAYDVDKVIRAVKLVKKTGIELWITPVYLPGLNDNDIEELIKFSMKNNCGIGIQKYEVHKYGRKIKKVKEQNYFQFYKKLDEWEKRFNVKLKYGASDIGVRKVKQLPVKLEKGKIYAVSVMKEGWMKGQMIGAAENRAVTLVDCDKNKGAVIKARVIENKNNIYMVK